jgi:hypothetical protein
MSGEAISTARLKLLPYRGAGHWRGEATSRIRMDPFRGWTAHAAAARAAPDLFRPPTPVLAGTRRSKTPRSR